jgi:hypothetical protein
MQTSVMLGRVALLRTDVSEDRIACIIRVTRIGDPGIMLAVTSIDITLRRRVVFCLKQNVLETRFCFRLEVDPPGQEREQICLLVRTECVPPEQTESGLRNAFISTNRSKDNVLNVDPHSDIPLP